MSKIRERELAVDTLTDILSEGAYNNIAIRKVLNKNNALADVHKAFVTELINGTLRNLIYIDFVINKFSKTPTSKMKPFILNNLRVGVYQILFMDRTPNSAACNEAVNLTKARKFTNLAGFVNGILRNIARESDIPIPAENYLAIKYSYPSWLIDYWRKEMDDKLIENMLIANSRSPKVSICANLLKTDVENLKSRLIAEGIEAENGYDDYCLYISKTSDISKSKAFHEGLFHVMDENAMKAVKMLEPRPGCTMVDVCGAPGGKTFFAGYLMSNQGRIVSRDIYGHKIELIKEQAKRLGIDIICAELADALVYDPSLNEYADCLLIDAPCSGFGLIRKKPDIKYTKTLEDINNLVSLQRSIFAACWKYVKKGGYLVYSTCTVSSMENIENVNFFVENYPLELVESIQILPGEKYGDGFFIAKFLRRK